MRTIELFAGAGGFALGAKAAGAKAQVLLELDADACATLRKAGSKIVVEASIDDWIADGHAAAYRDDIDLLTAGFPCFPAGSRVLTSSGFCPIEKIRVGDRVLTHTGQYREVTTTMRKRYRGRLIEVTPAYGRRPMKCTPEHPFFVRERIGREYGEPQWVEAKDLTTAHLLLEPRVTQTESPPPASGFDLTSEAIAWICGFFLAEGHFRQNQSMVFSIATHEVEAIQQRLIAAVGRPGHGHPHGRGAARIIIGHLGLYEVLRTFGRGAAHKLLPEWVYSMPVAWQQALIAGYMAGDGSYRSHPDLKPRGGYWMATSVSRDLIDGVLRLISSAHSVVGRSSRLYGAGTAVIEERTVNVKEAWSVGYAASVDGRRRPAFVDGHGAWIPIRSVAQLSAGTLGSHGEVFNLEVAEDNSYTVETIAVHNCQCWSSAGKQLGARDPRNKWPATFKAITVVRPRWVVCENVQGLTHHLKRAKCGKGRDPKPMDCPRCYLDGVILPELRSVYPVVEWRLINAADHAVPQQRIRWICVAGPTAIEWPEPTHSGEALAVAKWETGAYWDALGMEPVGEPSQDEVKWFSVKLRGPRYACEPWVTMRQALGLYVEGVDGLDWSVRHQSPSARTLQRVADEPSQGVGVKGVLYVEAERVEGRQNAAYDRTVAKRLLVGTPKHPDVSIDLPPNTIRSGGGGHDASHRWLKVIEGGKPPTEARRLSDAAHLAASPRDPAFIDTPAPTVTGQEVKGTRASASSGWKYNGGPDRASDALFSGAGRRRLTWAEAAVLQGFPMGLCRDCYATASKAGTQEVRGVHRPGGVPGKGNDSALQGEAFLLGGMREAAPEGVGNRVLNARNKAMRSVRATTGPQTVGERTTGGPDQLHAPQILQHSVLGQGQPNETAQGGGEVGGSPQTGAEGQSVDSVREVWGDHGGTAPQERGDQRQQGGEPGEPLPLVPHQRTSASESVRNDGVSRRSLRQGILREALPAVAQVGRPAGSEGEPAQACKQCRKLIAGRVYSWPFQGTDTERYRQVGNACPPALAEAVVRAVIAADRGRAWVTIEDGERWARCSVCGAEAGQLCSDEDGTEYTNQIHLARGERT